MAFVLSGQVLAAGYVVFDSHNTTLKLDVPAHAVSIEDTGTMTVAKDWNLFLLNAAAAVESFTINGQAFEYMAVPFNDVAGLPDKMTRDMPEIDSAGHPQLVFLNWRDNPGPVEFALKYRAELYQDVSNIRFSNEKVGGEVTATIAEQGAYLSPQSYFVPVGDETPCTYRLTADIPGEWESISDGNLLAEETVDGRKVQTWENPYKSDGVTFFASAFTTASVEVDSVWVHCYFFPEDAHLMNNYLRATTDYVRMYSELIGPYPFDRFTIVANFFPTGYGMPGWTLLGQQVLRLPFIISTSLGHEVLHNWWGNSVFVDYESGNWCEGLTVYGADYRYKLLQSPDMARDYRKDILKQYDSYVTEENDFPLTEFKSRTSPKTRTVGYNKAMMIFHMIEREIGTEAFFQAWKNIYSRAKGQKVAWQDWIDAFQEASRVKLSHIIPDWVERPGAPTLSLEVQDFSCDGVTRNCTVKFKLMQTGQPNYRLQVPVRVSGPGGVVDTVLALKGGDASYEITRRMLMQTIEVDPDYHLFRRLYPEEVEPVVSAILGNPNKAFVSFVDTDTAGAFGAFGLNMTEDTVDILPAAMVDSLPDSDYAVVLNPAELPDYFRGRVILRDDSVRVKNIPYPRGGHTYILTGQDWNTVGKYMVILTDDYESLPRIGQLIPHYGKYSFLVFEGARNVGKGQWEVGQSPLKKKLVLEAVKKTESP
ncbi:MAG: hypothetical protein JSW34_12290 [Candidatus Zixiibacteriota bacterium]|nr:MAG: hypothetical protein JSW34_12290 [candidate division Zixibacteria bacterium]